MIQIAKGLFFVIDLFFATLHLLGRDFPSAWFLIFLFTTERRGSWLHWLNPAMIFFKTSPRHFNFFINKIDNIIVELTFLHEILSKPVIVIILMEVYGVSPLGVNFYFYYGCMRDEIPMRAPRLLNLLSLLSIFICWYDYFNWSVSN